MRKTVQAKVTLDKDDSLVIKPKSLEKLKKKNSPEKDDKAQKDVHQYNSFTKMLGPESLAKVLPGVESIEEATTRTCPLTSIRCMTFLEKILSLHNYSDQVVGCSCARKL
ncbi:hypothetical protein CMV_014488 [Castanea mollissima]|uniref:Uncharacterized protein n=1 Tax=Castanea mollissima TaxID=60419 RepID=A0A8J4RBJ6_9ROSI|nr:hypothetical protein CMV_014488 [Castanea mollissima]